MRDEPRPGWWQQLAQRAAQPPLRPREALRLGATIVGSVEAELAARLRDQGLLDAQGALLGEPDATLARIARWLHDAGLARRWRGESMPVRDDAGTELARIERSAVRPLGIATFAVHLIGFTPRGEVWVQQRAHDKATDPGLWDTLMGGLVAAGESDAEALERETWEEAGLRVGELRDLRRAERITIRRPVTEGYMVEHIEVYAAVVPEGVVPVNQDGEVARFERLAPPMLLQRLAADEFTLEAALMLAGHLRRRGTDRAGGASGVTDRSRAKPRHRSTLTGASTNEKPMDPKAHWDHVYGSKAVTEVSWYQPHAERSLALVRRLGGGRPFRLIDVGGGASTLVDDLLALPGSEVSVLDISPAALDVARQRLGARAGDVQWLAGDVTTAALPAHAYDIWHDRAVFHFLTEPAQRAAYVAQVRHAVRPGGHVIVAAFGPEGPLQCSGLPVVRYAPGELHAQFGGAFELIAHDTETHRTPGGAVQQFVYCLCVMH